MDGVRAAMMLLGVVFHAALPYTSARHFAGGDAASRHVAFDWLTLFLHSFRMPVFFIAAGFFAAMLLERRGALGMARNRFMRIVLPLAIGFALLLPLASGASDFARAVARSDSVIFGFEKLAAGDWLRWNNIHHLWFLFVLLAFYPVGVAVQAVLVRLGPVRRALVAGARRVLASPWRPIILAVFCFGALSPAAFDAEILRSLSILPALPVLFALGWVVYGQRDMLAALRRHAWVYVGVGLALLPLAVATFLPVQQGAKGADPLTAAIAMAVMMSFLAFGILGLALTYLDRPNRAVRYASDAAYWIYLVHFPLVVFIGGLLAALAIPSWLKFLINVSVATTILFLSYHYLVRFTVIGLLLNGRRHARGRGGDAAERVPEGP